MSTEVVLLAGAFALVALLYATVGHGGGSGYLAVMAIAGFAPEAMRPTALLLNVVVSLVGTLRFARAGAFEGRRWWPLVVTSIPCAVIGGGLVLAPELYRPIVGLVLLVSALRLGLRLPNREHTSRLPLPLALGAGGGIGLLSGLVGVGGGIFLSPLLLLGGWATARQTAGISAPFILVNSLAALGGIAIAGTATPIDPLALSAWAVAVLLAGWVGAGVGSRRLRHPALRRLLSIVLLAAATKMFLAPRGHDGGAADRIGATPVNPDD